MNAPQRLESPYDRELAELEALTEHAELAAAAALDYCAEEGIPPPMWAVKRASALLCQLLKRERADKAGRAVGRVARYRRDQWDVERWDAVEETRRIKRKVDHNLKIIESKPHWKGTPQGRNFEKLAAWFSRYGIFACASMYLSGRDARIGADGMRASHRRCKKRAGNGTRPDRYYVFDERFLFKIGFPRLQDRKPGTKWLPLYDLTC